MCTDTVYMYNLRSYTLGVNTQPVIIFRHFVVKVARSLPNFFYHDWIKFNIANGSQKYVLSQECHFPQILEPTHKFHNSADKEKRLTEKYDPRQSWIPGPGALLTCLNNGGVRQAHILYPKQSQLQKLSPPDTQGYLVLAYPKNLETSKVEPIVQLLANKSFHEKFG